MRYSILVRSRWSLFAVLVCGLSHGISAVADSLPNHDRRVDYAKRFSFDLAKGSGPTSQLLMADDGNLYGTTQNGGAYNTGVLFKMTREGRVTVLHSFIQDGTDGFQPIGALMQDRAGGIWGTTSFGGAFYSGTIFHLSRKGDYSVVHAFEGGATGCSQSYAPLVEGPEGSVLGTTAFGGDVGQGCIFQLSKAGAFSVLHSLSGTEGKFPQWGLTRVGHHTYVGTTVQGGDANGGTVFRITTSGEFARLYSFEPGVSGVAPSILILARDKRLYGAAAQGGPSSGGTIFSMSLAGDVTVLHAFGSVAGEGDSPTGLTEGEDGAFYGSNANFGSDQLGNVFRMTAAGAVTVLHRFSPGSAAFPDDGAQPMAPPALAGRRSLYGTTFGGGMSGITPGYGTIYRLSTDD